MMLHRCYIVVVCCIMITRTLIYCTTVVDRRDGRFRLHWRKIENRIVIVCAVCGQALWFQFRLDCRCCLDETARLGTLWHGLECSTCDFENGMKLEKFLYGPQKRNLTCRLEWHDSNRILRTAVRKHRHRRVKCIAFVLMQWINWFRLSRHIVFLICTLRIRLMYLIRPHVTRFVLNLRVTLITFSEYKMTKVS